ncbi:glycosyltransferase family 2 protein [Candidatus Latescibacterota bacterium]
MNTDDTKTHIDKIVTPQKISVIIPVHGRSELLVRCLRSLDTNTDVDFEVCVVDDGSGLDELEIREKSDVSFPLLWRSFDAVKGRSATRNEGLRSTSGDIIVFLDSDMEAGDGFIRAHFQSHSEQPNTAVIGKINWPRNGSFLKYIGTRGIAKLNENDTVPPWYFVTGNASVRRDCLPFQKPFDENLPGWGGEDLDLGMRLYNNGVRFTVNPEAVSYHHFDGDLKVHIERTFLYGSSTLPVLTARYPEILRVTKLHLLDSFIWRLLVSKVFFIPVYGFVSALDKLPLPAALFDYLTFASYAAGWLKGRRA